MRNYGPTIRSYLKQKCSDPEDEQDLYQECLCAIHAALPRFAGRSSLSTWIHAVCRNVFSNYVYYRQRDRNLLGRLAADRETTDAEEIADLRLLIETLPPLLRSVYRHYYAEGRSVREAAAILGKPEGTVKYLLHELRASLRMMLG
jgi:RNA polymerase sigma-70 factor (ECF subfamily)